MVPTSPQRGGQPTTESVGETQKRGKERGGMNLVVLRRRVVVLVWAALLSLGAAGALAAHYDAPDDAPMVVQPTPLQENEQPEFAAADIGGTAPGGP
jgi:hypothetical protein